MIYDPWQKNVLKAEGDLLLCTSRQVGKTTILSHKAGERLISQRGCNILVVSLTEDQAQLIIVMVLTYLEKNYKNYIAKGTKKPTKNRIHLKNGSMILSRPVGNTGNAMRGFTGDVLIIDEASRMNEFIFEASMPTLFTTGGDIWICSTPFGKRGFFYKCYENEDGDWKVFHTNSEEVLEQREITEDWTEYKRDKAIKFLEKQKKAMSSNQYKQEYLGEFIDDLRQFFSDNWINRICVLRRRTFTPKLREYYLGIDLARLGGDEITYEVLDKIDFSTIEQVESIVYTKQLTTSTFDKIKELDMKYDFTKIAIDTGSGSLGVGLWDFLLKDDQVKSKLVPIDNAKISLSRDGKKKRSLFKEDLYDNLKVMGERRIIKLLDDEKLRLSLKSVQYEYVIKPGKPSQLRIFGDYTHIVEGLVRSAWLANQKHSSLWLRSI